MKRKLVFSILFVPFLIVSCGSNQSPATPTEQFEEYKIDFSSMELGSSNLIQSSDSTFKSKVLGFLSSSSNERVTDISYSENNYIRVKNDIYPGSYGSNQTLILASQNYDGYLSMSFSKELRYIKIEAQQYYSITGGYNEDPHFYPYYDCQKYNEETSESEGDPDAYLDVSNHHMHIDCISYQYDNDGYPIVNIPPMNESTIEINSDHVTLTALASYRIKVYSLTLLFKL